MAHDERTSITRGEAQSVLVHTRDLDDFKIPDGQPDPRGWSVKTADGTTLGKVEDLIVDTGEARVRYLEVKTDSDFAKHGGREYFLLPIGTARLDDASDDVIVSLAAESLTGAPAYERGNVSREYETSLRDYVRERPATDATGATGTAMSSSTTGDREVSFYGSPEYDDASFFSRGRERHAGSVGDRVRNTLDDVHDRVDGNPASRPGPDATDRR